MIYNLFIGRYQSPHKGHMTIFNEYLDKQFIFFKLFKDNWSEK